MMRIGTVDFDTAGTDDSDFTFFGIANPDVVVAQVDRALREPPTPPPTSPEAVDDETAAQPAEPSSPATPTRDDGL